MKHVTALIKTRNIYVKQIPHLHVCVYVYLMVVLLIMTKNSFLFCNTFYYSTVVAFSAPGSLKRIMLHLKKLNIEGTAINFSLERLNYYYFFKYNNN